MSWNAVFLEAVENVLEREGGYVNHPKDRGGPTNFGITIRTLEHFRGLECTEGDVKALTKKEAIEIYRKLYWEPFDFENWAESSALASILFDISVNRGHKAAIKLFQKTAKIREDGILGVQTRKQGLDFSHEDCIELILNLQISYVQIVEFNPSQLVFLRGWLSRSHDLMREVI